MYYYFAPSEFFTPALLGGFSLESRWQQVSSSLLDISKYIDRSQQYSFLRGLDSSAIVHFFWSFLKPLEAVTSASLRSEQKIVLLSYIILKLLWKKYFQCSLLYSFCLINVENIFSHLLTIQNAYQHILARACADTFSMARGHVAYCEWSIIK